MLIFIKKIIGCKTKHVYSNLHATEVQLHYTKMTKYVSLFYLS